MKSIPYRERARGFSTIEMLIAFSVAIIFLTSATLVAFGGQSAGLDAELTNRGIYTVATQLQDAVASTTKNWTTLPLPSSPTFYTQNNIVHDISPCLKYISSDANWTTEHLRTQHIGVSTFFGNPSASLALGKNCDPFPVSAWSQVGAKGSVSSTDGEKGTAMDIATIAGIHYAFVTTTHANEINPDFWVINVTNPASPTIVASLNTGKGLNDIDVVTTHAGTFAYVVQNDEKDQLQTIVLSDPIHPVLTSTISFETYGVDKHPIGSDPEGRVIYFYNGRLYAGLKTTVGPELLVFDVSSSPAQPNFLGAISTSFNHTVNDIVVRGNYAYLATGYDSRELMIIDVSNSIPVDTGYGFNTNASSGNTLDATSIYLLGNTLYLGLERASVDPRRDLYLLDIGTDQRTLTLLGSKRLGLKASSSVGSIIAQWPYAFLSTSNPTDGFQMWNISDPATIFQPNAGGCSTFKIPAGIKIHNLIYQDGFVYIVTEGIPLLQIISDTGASCL